MRPFDLAAAAEAAGFRACLRCRPYRTDQPVTWVGPELLCRAVQLIVDGTNSNTALIALGYVNRIATAFCHDQLVGRSFHFLR